MPEPNSSSANWPASLVSAACLAVLLAVHAALAVDTLRRKTATVDEVGHLPAGISYWQKGTFELYHHNPPLIKLVCAAAALSQDPKVDYSGVWDRNHGSNLPISAWNFGWEFMYANPATYDRIYFWARLPNVGLSLLTMVFVFAWSRDLFGNAAGLLSAGLWAISPNIIAHAGVVTTDLGASGIGFAATYLFARYLRRPSLGAASATGILLGLGQLTKFSLLVLYPLWAGIGVIVAVAARSKQRFVTFSWHYVLTVSLSVLVINAGYLFEGTGTRLGDYTFLSKTLTRPRHGPPPLVDPQHPWKRIIESRQNLFAGTMFEKLPTPFPYHYVAGFDEQKFESEGGYPVYLNGKVQRTGWWWYYGFAALIKVPLGTWLLTAMVCFLAIKSPHEFTAQFRNTRIRNDPLALVAPPLLTMLLMSFLTDINLGLRYILAIFPYWFVILSSPLSCVGRWGRWMVAAALLLNLSALRHHPNHLAYFNELVGGPDHGAEYLIDSNIDWGQDLGALNEWMRDNRPGEQIQLAYFGNVDPSILKESAAAFSWVLAQPRSWDEMELLQVTQRSPLFEHAQFWIRDHSREVEQWLATASGRTLWEKLWHLPGFRDEVLAQLELDRQAQPKLIAVSTNFVYGLPFRVRDHQGNIWDARGAEPPWLGAYTHLQEHQPIGRAGGSILIFER